MLDGITVCVKLTATFVIQVMLSLLSYHLAQFLASQKSHLSGKVVRPKGGRLPGVVEDLASRTRFAKKKTLMSNVFLESWKRHLFTFFFRVYKFFIKKAFLVYLVD